MAATYDSRKYFNLHLLRSDVVGDILGCDGQLVHAGDCLARGS